MAAFKSHEEKGNTTIMTEQLYFDDKLSSFFDKISEMALDVEAYEENIKEAIKQIADLLRLGRAVIMLDAPVTKIRPSGVHRDCVLYDRGLEAGDKIYRVMFTLPDKGQIVVEMYPLGDESFSQEKCRILDCIVREIFSQYSRIMMQDMLNHIINTDIATGVASQEAFMQYAGRLLAMKQLNAYYAIFFNIHNFKYVNKVFPYAEGDIILRNCALKIQDMLEADEIIARLGGDNFVMLVKAANKDKIVDEISNLRMYYRTEAKEKEFLFGATIGVSALDDVTDPKEVMARTSIAYQTARRRGAGKTVEYTEQVRQELMETQSIISNFIPALEAHEFIVLYQPKVNISQHSICGAEAIVRWNRKGTLIPPIKFVPPLEREGSICQLDYYVLEEVCKFLSRRIREGKEPLCISVNFSRKHLEGEKMVEQIVEMIDRYRIDHQYIEIELTESQDYQNYERITGIVNELKNNGIGISMDDFGTGFSSLNMIKQVDLKVIKIDKSFIPLETNYPGKEKDIIMFRNIVSLIKQLGKKTIAEGVENKAQLQYLKDAGCDIVQGYVFDEPLTEEEFECRLQEGYNNSYSKQAGYATI